MIKKMKQTILLLIIFFGISTIQADMITPSHMCSKPYKPLEFTSQYEVDTFNDDVRRYKQCIVDFVEEQNQAIKNHQDAQEEAIEEWNRYVRYELN